MTDLPPPPPGNALPPPPLAAPAPPPPQAAPPPHAPEPTSSENGGLDDFEDGTRPDIVAAVKRMGLKFGSKREIRKLPEHLWDNEMVEYLASGFYGRGLGLVALTDHRLIFLRDAWTSTQLEDFPISEILSVNWSTGIVLGQLQNLGKLQVFVAGSNAEISNMQKPAGKAIAERLRARISDGPQPAPAPPAAAPPPAPTPVADSGSDVISKLRELGELRDAGILDDAEFSAAKAKLLG